ncbi:hypothetical protein GWK47_010923 [Chionoecetes opilio]|uniref:Uncharacterized protein n=1 Tax=Chionoecetes opilio TaxID=41210 RepID=A0A8J5CNS7_CHIOP|nr:hypothetical protein GWK47_010923 [Chionoecetes opilio]
MDLQVLQEREDLRDELPGIGQNLSSFSSVVPLPVGIRFLSPGAMHQARWMSKVLYSFKIWMFPGPVPLDEEGGAWTPAVGLFVVRVYAKAWIEAFFLGSSPSTRPELIKALGTQTRSTLRSETSRCRNCQAICGTCQKNWLGCPSSTPTCPARPKKAMVTALRREEFYGEGHGSGKESRFQRSRSEISPGRLRQWTYSPLLRKLHLDEAFLDLPPGLVADGRGVQRSSRSSGTSLW